MRSKLDKIHDAKDKKKERKDSRKNVKSKGKQKSEIYQCLAVTINHEGNLEKHKVIVRKCEKISREIHAILAKNHSL